MTTAKIHEITKTPDAVSPTVLESLKDAVTTLPVNQGGRVVLDITALTPPLRSKVERWYHELSRSIPAFGKAGLAIGATLREARTTLKPLGLWMAFLNRLPGMSARTGDRFIKRYEMAGRRLPEPVLALAITSGVDLAGVDDAAPYGRYSRAVAKVGKPPRSTGDPDRDTERARVWLGRVLVVQARERGKARQTTTSDPTITASDELVRRIERYVADREGQISFLKRVLQRTLRRLGYGDLIVGRSLEVAKKRSPERSVA